MKILLLIFIVVINKSSVKLNEVFQVLLQSWIFLILLLLLLSLSLKMIESLGIHLETIDFFHHVLDVHVFSLICIVDVRMSSLLLRIDNSLILSVREKHLLHIRIGCYNLRSHHHHGVCVISRRHSVRIIVGVIVSHIVWVRLWLERWPVLVLFFFLRSERILTHQK